MLEQTLQDGAALVFGDVSRRDVFRELCDEMLKSDRLCDSALEQLLLALDRFAPPPPELHMLLSRWFADEKGWLARVAGPKHAAALCAFGQRAPEIDTLVLAGLAIPLPDRLRVWGQTPPDFWHTYLQMRKTARSVSDLLALLIPMADGGQPVGSSLIDLAAI